MTKRYGQLFDAMFTLEALHAAYLLARKRKRKKSATARFERDLGANLQALHAELLAGTYTPRPYKTFEVFEPKRRLIYAPHFRDVVVQHAIYKVIYPIFDATFCRESYGCRVGLGTHKAADRAQQFLRAASPESYLLQFDVRKFFYSIDRGVLMGLWARKIKDDKVLHLLALFGNYPEPAGIPIGNLLSQLAALVYLNPLDHFIKRELGVKHYVRYVDDFIVFGLTQVQACAMRHTIERWLKDTLHLELSKWIVQPSNRGLNFVGFRTWRKTRFVRKHTLCKFSRNLRAGNIPAVVSALGHARRTATWRHFVRRVQAERTDLVPSLPFSTRLSFQGVNLAIV